MAFEFLSDLLERPDQDFGKSFLGVGIGLDGIPIDFLKVYLLTKALDDYSGNEGVVPGPVDG